VVDFHGADVHFEAGSLLSLDIDGAAPGSQHDQLTGLGTLSFDGTLQLVFGTAFNPAAGQRLDLLDFASLHGGFDPARISVTGFDRQRLDLSHLAGDGSVTILAAPVPEPQTWALLLAGGLGLAGLQRRRRAKSDGLG
jgi:hypothetical protein